MKKFTNNTNYDKLISNIFGWGIVDTGVIRAKVKFGEWIPKDGLIKRFLYMYGRRKFVVGEM